MDLFVGLSTLNLLVEYLPKQRCYLNQRAKQCIKCLKLKECEYSYAYS